MVSIGEFQEEFSDSLRLTGAIYFGCARVSYANDCCYLKRSRYSIVAACSLMNVLLLLVCAL